MPTSHPNPHIAIIGGGPAGAASAALLAQRGIPVTLCETKPFPRHKVCGEFLSAAARPALARLGLLHQFDALAGPPIRTVRVCMLDQHLEAPMPPDPQGHFPRTIRRDQLDSLLLAHAHNAGVTVLQPCRVSHVTGTAHTGFTLHTPQGPLHATAVVLAHGLAQRGDMAAPPSPPPPNTPAYVCFKTHLAHCPLPDDTIAVGGAPGVYAGVVRTSSIDATPTYTFAFVARKDLLSRVGNTPEALARHLASHNPAFGRLLAPATPRMPYLASGPLLPGIRTVYHDGRFFVGNAAGEVHALIGEGMTLALRAAVLLADTLATGPARPADLPALGASYERQWRAAFTHRYHAAQIFANILMQPTLNALANTLLTHFPELLTTCIRHAGGKDRLQPA